MATLAEVSDLSGRGDIRIGGTLVRPVSRELHGIGGSASVEPRVMQVLLTLAYAKGEVVTRSELVGRCWNGLVVGEDAISRAIGEVRRLARTVAGGEFAVETITKTGYRLVGASLAPAKAGIGSVPAAGRNPAQWSRRALIASGGVATVGAMLVSWRARPSAEKRRAAALLDRGTIALREGLPDSEAQGLGFLREAVALDPENADAWGKLALAWSGAAEHAGPAVTADAVNACQASARRAIALDPRQSDAHVALTLLTPTFGDWAAAERRFNATLTVAPDHPALLGAFGVLMAEVGRMRAARSFIDRAIAVEPLSPVLHFRRTYQLWNQGRVAEADRAVDRAMQLWPRHPGLWNVRLLLFAFTGRLQSAAALLDGDSSGRPSGLPSAAITLWRLSLAALGWRRAEDINRAVDAHLASALTGGPAAVNAILVLTQLGALDEAFAVAEGYLLRRGALAGLLGTSPDQLAMNDQRRRKTMMLFTAATQNLRADPRFAKLCADIGLRDYWRAAGIGPDYAGGGIPA